MSARANIVLFDKWTGEGRAPLYFYQHGDGYPDGVREKLDKFGRYLSERRIRRNTGQASNWLIFLGIQEMAKAAAKYSDQGKYALWKQWAKGSILEVEPALPNDRTPPEFEGDEWQAGFVQVTHGIHGDVEYVHFVNCNTGAWFSKQPSHDLLNGNDSVTVGDWVMGVIQTALRGSGQREAL